MSMIEHDDTPHDPDTGEILQPLAKEVSPVIAAEINQQVATAKRYPRRRDKEVSDEIMGRASLTADIASECMYSLKRGDKMITGPSIRFAEIVRASYGNIRVASRFVRVDDDDRSRAAVIVEAAALDLQTNNAEIIPVRRSVMTSGKGDRAPRMFSADMINMTVNAAASIARRNAILAVVPKAVWIEGYHRVVQVLQGDVKTLADRRQQVVEAFGRVKVAPEELFGALGVKSIEDITIEHMPTLQGMMTAIKEGEPVDSVLGRQTEATAATHRVVANPLADHPPSASNGQGGQQQPVHASSAQAGAHGGSTAKVAPAATGGASEGVRQEQAAPDQQPMPKPQPEPSVQQRSAEPAQQRGADPGTFAMPEDVAARGAAYVKYALGWISVAQDMEDAQLRYRSERKIRKECVLSDVHLETVKNALDKKLAELRDRE